MARETERILNANKRVGWMQVTEKKPHNVNHRNELQAYEEEDVQNAETKNEQKSQRQ